MTGIEPDRDHPGRDAAPARATSPRVDPWDANEAAIRDRLRTAGRRSLGENLSDGLDMIETLSTLTGTAARPR